MKRKIVRIDEARCDGCGRCLPSCAEGAIRLEGGKARLARDVLCDGLGACLGDCPQGALSIVEREAEPFDAGAVAVHVAVAAAQPAPLPRGQPPAHPGAQPPAYPGAQPHAHPGAQPPACPGAQPRALPRRGLAVLAGPAASAPVPAPGAGGLASWPVQLALLPPGAPFLRGADLLVAADCAAFACPSFHAALLAGRVAAIGCPKLDDLPAHEERLGRILARPDGPRAVTVARMEVPCCAGLAAIARRAARARDLPVREVIVGVDGALRG